MVRHHIGVIGGSGLYQLRGLTDVQERLVPTPFGEPSGAAILGTLGTTRFYFLPRHGRHHDVPPHRINYRANIFALKSLGARQLVSISAVGSLQERLAPGDFVLVDQFIDRTHGRAGSFFDDQGIVAHVTMADPVDASLSRTLADAGRTVGATVHEGGTYLCIQGPQFSTRAESQLFRQWGADVIGMTNLPEARLAREAELPYASLAMVTDYDCWHQVHEQVSVDAVLSVLAGNAQRAEQVLSAIEHWPDPTRSPAFNALQSAFLTPLHTLTKEVQARLEPLVGRYVPPSD